MLAKYAMIAATAAVALAAPAAFAGEAKYETRQFWNGRGFVTHVVAKPTPAADRPYALTGRQADAAKPVKLETVRVGSRIVAVYPANAR